MYLETVWKDDLWHDHPDVCYLEELRPKVLEFHFYSKQRPAMLLIPGKHGEIKSVWNCFVEQQSIPDMLSLLWLLKADPR